MNGTKNYFRLDPASSRDGNISLFPRLPRWVTLVQCLILQLAANHGRSRPPVRVNMKASVHTVQCSLSVSREIQRSFKQVLVCLRRIWQKPKKALIKWQCFEWTVTSQAQEMHFIEGRELIPSRPSHARMSAGCCGGVLRPSKQWTRDRDVPYKAPRLPLPLTASQPAVLVNQELCNLQTGERMKMLFKCTPQVSYASSLLCAGSLWQNCCSCCVWSRVSSAQHICRTGRYAMGSV